MGMDKSSSQDAVGGRGSLPTPPERVELPQSIEFSIYQPMLSASGDAAERKYHLFVGKGGKRWAVADQPEAADNIYVDGGPGSQGMAGRTLTFELVGGGSADFIGPWKTTADELFADTGHDVRGRCGCRGILAYHRQQGKVYGPETYSEILHYDAEPVLRAYGWLKQRAQEIADATGRTVYRGEITKGGGCSDQHKPRIAPPPVDDGAPSAPLRPPSDTQSEPKGGGQ